MSVLKKINAKQSNSARSKILLYYFETGFKALSTHEKYCYYGNS